MSLGFRMRAEGETAYEPDVLLRLEAHRPAKNKPTIPVAHVEKDRSGILAGQTIAWPNFDNIAKPLIGLLGTNHATAPTEDEVGQQDAEALARQDIERVARSAELAAQYTACFGLANGVADLERGLRSLAGVWVKYATTSPSGPTWANRLAAAWPRPLHPSPRLLGLLTRSFGFLPFRPPLVRLVLFVPRFVELCQPFQGVRDADLALGRYFGLAVLHAFVAVQ